MKPKRTQHDNVPETNINTQIPEYTDDMMRSDIAVAVEELLRQHPYVPNQYSQDANNSNRVIQQTMQVGNAPVNQVKVKAIKSYNSDNRGLSKEALDQEAKDRTVVCPIYYYLDDMQRSAAPLENVYKDLNGIAADMNENYIFSNSSVVQDQVVINLARERVENIIENYNALIHQNILSYIEYALRTCGAFLKENYEVIDGIICNLASDMSSTGGMSISIRSQIREFINVYLRSEVENKRNSISNHPDWLLVEYQARICTCGILNDVGALATESISKSIWMDVRIDSPGVKSAFVEAIIYVINQAMNGLYPLIYSNLMNIQASLINSNIQGFNKACSCLYGPYSTQYKDKYNVHDIDYAEPIVGDMDPLPGDYVEF